MVDTTWKRHGNLLGVAERYIPTDDGFARQKVQDIEPIVDDNRRLANETDGRSAGGSFRKVGSIPATVYYQWIVEWQRKGLIGPGNMDRVNELCLQRLRDSDYAKFRTTWGGI